MCAILECNLASFPGLPRFYLLFLFTIRPAKNRKDLGAFVTSLMSGGHWGGGGGGVHSTIYDSNMHPLNLKASFLPIKQSSFDYAKVLGPKLQ